MEYASILGRPLALDELQNHYVAMDCMQYNLMYHPRLQQMKAGEDKQDDDDEEEMEEEEDFLIDESEEQDFLIDESDEDVEEE